MRTVMVRDSNGSAKVPPVDLAQSPLEKSALGVIGDQRERSRVALRRFRRGSDAAQQVGARGMEKVIAVEVAGGGQRLDERSEEHTSELQSRLHLVCRLLLEKKKNKSATISCAI